MPITYSLKEKNNNKIDVSHKELLDLLKKEEETQILGDFETAYKLEYSLSLKKSDIVKICQYYGIKTRRKKKEELIEQIFLFENNNDNEEIVERRKILWFYLAELKNDSYMKQFIIYS